MVRSQGNDASFGRTLDPAPQTACLPHRWWATPGYAAKYDGKSRPAGRPRGALIRAHAIAGVPLVRGAGA
jgi:hypothetical protein